MKAQDVIDFMNEDKQANDVTLKKYSILLLQTIKTINSLTHGRLNS